MNDKKYDSIVFYDGDCGFCNSTVQFILSKRKRIFYFSPLQSDFAKVHLGQHGIEIEIDTIYYSIKGKIYERSSAALQISKGLKGILPLLYFFYVVPRFLRDWIYNGIAKRRHRLRSGYCVIPTKQNQEFFIEISD
jgi:predicted DCC family thiol-disulfide oxidoreductase YuxK